LSHLTEQQVTRYVHKRLLVADLLAVDEHLSECVECSQQIVILIQSNLRSSENNFYNYDINPHLIFEDQVKYLSNQLTEERLEYCLNHLIWCESCRLELLDFSIFCTQLNSLDNDFLMKNKHQPENSSLAPLPISEINSQNPQ
jgi:hypothetical protein